MDTLTPQQELFLASYLNPKSETWGNAKQSALKANYSEEYSDNIMSLMPKWLSENIGDTKLTDKALKNLDLALEGGLDSEEGSKNIQWKATETTLKSLLNNKFGDKKNIDITTQGEKIVMTPENLALTQRYESELKEGL